jgi:hypothetical protein
MVLLFFVSFYLIFYDDNFLCILVPIKIYKNAATERIKIQKENRGLSGIYLFKNLTTGNSILALQRKFPKDFEHILVKKDY